MSNKEKVFLIDTSVQIKRLLSDDWKDSSVDIIWQAIEPVTCFYSFMEFKNCVIGAIDYLISILIEIQDRDNTKKGANIRLNEVIKYLNLDSTKREGIRRHKLANYYAAKIIDENNYYPDEKRTNQDIVYYLKCEGELLEKIGFYYYSKNKKPIKMDVLNISDCFLGIHCSPLINGRAMYTCNKNQLECKIFSIITSNQFRKMLIDIQNKKIKIKEGKLKKGALSLIEHDISKLSCEKCIGQQLCWPLGDCILVYYALYHNISILTYDGDQVSIGDFYKVHSKNMSTQKMIIIEEVKKTLNNTPNNCN